MALASETLSTRAEPFLVAGCAVEPNGLRVTVDGRKVRVEAKVMLVLVYLADHAGRVVSRAELEEQLWPGRVVTEDSVTKAIAKIRLITFTACLLTLIRKVMALQAERLRLIRIFPNQ